MKIAEVILIFLIVSILHVSNLSSQCSCFPQKPPSSQNVSSLKDSTVLTYSLDRTKRYSRTDVDKFAVPLPQLIHTENVIGIGEIAVLMEGFRKEKAKLYLAGDNMEAEIICADVINNKEKNRIDIKLRIKVAKSNDTSPGWLDWSELTGDPFILKRKKTRMDLHLCFDRSEKNSEKDWKAIEKAKSSQDKICRIFVY